MIGDQITGSLPQVIIQAVTHEGLTVTVDGQAAQLAVVTCDGRIIAAGVEVANEARAVAVNSYRSFLKGRGHLRILSAPLTQGLRAIA
ncbi:hypothetical protein [Pantoea sp. 18069]|uniref:hypothetical protein n=1 Tax=Pantoea sp. 18069 TaxID=2681415 RepID=UPI00135A9BFD|nr:hypothetical protein [Pantoea sp. 18069]